MSCSLRIFMNKMNQYLWISHKLIPSYALIPYPILGTIENALPENGIVAVGVWDGPTVRPVVAASTIRLESDFINVLVTHTGAYVVIYYVSCMRVNIIITITYVREHFSLLFMILLINYIFHYRFLIYHFYSTISIYLCLLTKISILSMILLLKSII